MIPEKTYLVRTCDMDGNTTIDEYSTRENAEFLFHCILEAGMCGYRKIQLITRDWNGGNSRVVKEVIA